MANVLGGYQPDTKSESARRADFDLRRRIAAGGTGQPTIVTAGNALGIVAMGSVVAADPLTLTANTAIQATSSTAFTMLTGRRYRIAFAVRAVQSTAAAAYVQLRLRNGATDLFTSYPIVYVPASAAQFNAIYYEWVFNGDNTARSFNVALVASVTSSAYTNMESYFYIEDVGPNTSPALPIPATPPAWTPVSSFSNSWVNFGSTNEVVGYRKIGDIVYLRGSIKNGTVNTEVFILPAGFRPPKKLSFAAAGTTARADVDTTGSVAFFAGANGFGSFDGVLFSVTP